MTRPVLQDTAEGAAASAVRVTAAICTRGRPELLQRALASLLAQSAPPDEILVVENAREDGSLQDLLASRFPGVHYTSEPVPGLDFARNHALRSARGDVVAFLDDDATAEPGWAAAVRSVFAEPGVGACTGRILPLSLETEAQRRFEANGGLFASGEERLELPREARTRRLHGRRAPLIAWAVSVGSGANLAVRRSAALALGGFDEALDLGPALPGGGDNDMVWRILASGLDVVYEPRSRVRHEHRRELQAMHDQVIGHQRALIALLTKSARAARGRERLSILAFLGWRLLKPGVRLVRSALARDPLPARVLLRMWRDCFAGLRAYPSARAIAAQRVASTARAATER